MTELTPSFGKENPVRGIQFHIEPNRRVISEELSRQYDLYEFLDVTSERRLISLPRDSEQTRLHEFLSERYIPVFPVVDTTDERIFVSVPREARTLQNSLRFVARDIDDYSEIFSQLGEALGRCQMAGLGLPYASQERSVLGGVVYFASSTDAYGSNIRFAPPYMFDINRGKHQEITVLRQELEAAREFTPSGVERLIEAVSEGWEHVR